MESILNTIATQPFYLYTGTVLLGLTVGSFLNVVIYRLPIMMEQEWHEQCAELAGKELENKPAKFNLITPRSRCNQCGALIKAWQNIPLISYVLQHGRCAACGTKISIQYPVVEFATAFLSVIVVAKFGFSKEALAALFFVWALIALTVIDFQKQLLPDEITLLFLWCGILLNYYNFFTSLESAVIGAMVGYLALWSVFWLFKIVTGKEGMGYGDFKLLAMLCAWLGINALVPIILLSSIVGAIVGISLVAIAGRDRNIPIPFGPYLAAAGFIFLIYGKEIQHFYITWLTS